MGTPALCAGVKLDEAAPARDAIVREGRVTSALTSPRQGPSLLLCEEDRAGNDVA